MQNEIVNAEDMLQFEVTQDERGKFKRRAVYQPYSSLKPETTEQKIALFNLMEGDSEAALPMGEHNGAVLALSDVVIKPYNSVDEETGEIENGVLTYLFGNNDEVYVTSSKSVYHSLKNMFSVFGFPHYSEGEELEIKIVKKQGERFKYTDLELVGVAK